MFSNMTESFLFTSFPFSTVGRGRGEVEALHCWAKVFIPEKVETPTGEVSGTGEMLSGLLPSRRRVSYVLDAPNLPEGSHPREGGEPRLRLRRPLHGSSVC